MKRQSKGSRYRMHDYMRQLRDSYNQGIFKVPKQGSDLEVTSSSSLEDTIEKEVKARRLHPVNPLGDYMVPGYSQERGQQNAYKR